MMSLTVLGSSGGTPTRTNPASGYLVEAEGMAFWIDAGTGTFMELARHIDPGTLDGVVLSHLHIDHCTDLFGLYGYLAFGPSGEIPMPVLAPAGAEAQFAAFARATEGHFHAVFDFTEVEAGSSVKIDDVAMRFGEAVHPVPALVTRFETPDGILVYSGDTGPGSDLPELAEGADILLCEATIAGERDERTYPYHLTAREAGRIAANAGVRTLVVTHLASSGDPDQAFAEATSAYAGEIIMAMPGVTITIGEDR